MHYGNSFILILIIMPCHIASFSNKLTYPPKQDVYEFWLDVEYRVSMSHHDDEGAHALYYNIENGTFSRRTPCDKYEDYRQDLSKVIVGDGQHRFLLTFNQTVPGPTLTVYQNSTIIIHVTNNVNEPISVHWHGLTLKGAYFMDGVGMVSQCPIMPSQEFTYKFRVNEIPGTYWYHGHTGINLADGLYGPLIILSDDDVDDKNDHVAIIADWFQQEAYHLDKFVSFENEEYIPGYEDKEKCFDMPHDLDGTKVRTWPWNSGVVNGKGWHNVVEMENNLKIGKNLPIETFFVSSSINSKPKIRLISGSFVYLFIVSVSNHRLTVVAVDGCPVEPTTVDYIFMVQGERYDVILEPIDESSIGTHIMLVETVERFDHERNEDFKFVKEHFAAAIIVYDQNKPDAISIVDRKCTKDAPCTVLNCRCESYPASFNRSCIHLTDLRSKTLPPKMILDEKPDRFEQHFINLFADLPAYTINGIHHVMPSVPLVMQPNAYKKCADECGVKKKCKCTHIVSLNKDNVVEFVLYNRPKDTETMLTKGLGHPFHIHGHHFHVLEIGYPKINENGTLQSYNLATDCEHYYCNKAKWNSNFTTSNLRLKKISRKPIMKDTIFIPVGGYVVVRFVADNPGWWVAHCHQGPHHATGMSFIIKEGSHDEMPTIPGDFPVCGFKMKDIKRS